MKIKILVIFFLALIMSFIIYNVTLNNRKSILILGDNHLLDSNYKTYDKYLYDDLKDNVVFFNELFTEEGKTYKDIINDIKRNYKFYIGLFLIMALFLVRFDYVIYTPGSLENLNDRIIVTPSNESKGSMNLTYVTSIPANIPNMLLSLIIPNWDIESLNNMRYEDESEKEIENSGTITKDEVNKNQEVISNINILNEKTVLEKLGQ